MKVQSVISALQERIQGEGKSATISAEGTSMEPTILAGQPLRLSSCAPSELRRGDIVLYCSENRMVVHRVCEINRTREQIICKGDNRKLFDAPIPFHHVIGRITLEDSGLARKWHDHKARWWNAGYCRLRRWWKGKAS